VKLFHIHGTYLNRGGLLLLLPLAVLLHSQTPLFAQAGLAGAFLRVGLGARAKGMGDAYTALARGVEASYYNPAGLPLLENREVIASYRLLSLDRQFTYIGFAMPVRPKVASAGGDKFINGGFSLSWIRSGIDDIDGRNTDGQHFDNLSNSENAFIFAFALNPAKRFSVGLAVKVLWNRFPDIGSNGQTVSASGVGLDLGALFSPKEWVTLGLSIRDINSRYRWNTSKIFDEDGSESTDPFPKTVRYGLAVRPPNWRNVTLSFDYEQIYKSDLFSDKINDRFHFGGEASLLENIVVRAGLDDGTVAAGGGYEFPLFGKMSQINYSYTAAGNRPEEEHVFTWVFRF